MTGTGILRAALAAALFAVAGCDALAPVDPMPVPAARPDLPAPAPDPVRSEESKLLESYYRRVEQDFLAKGLLRTDGGGPDTPFSQRQLAQNFIDIALYDEFIDTGDALLESRTPSRLRRWQGPIRMTVEFGATVEDEQQARDREAIRNYTQRLSRITGLPIRMTDSNPNFHVFIMNIDENRELGTRLRQIVPDIGPGALAETTNLPRETYCIAAAIDPGNRGGYTRAFALIRAEHPDLLRLSCIHEEIAQALGLANDSPQARPSIFNDDEEFGLLTTHDEMLLEMLYDPRLTPGMTAEQARPIVQKIAAELLGGEA